MPIKPIIYLDNAATSKVLPVLIENYSKINTEYFANPGSIHYLGQESARLLQKAREQILSSLHVEDKEVIFTSGASEANNLALKGYALNYRNRGNHIIVSCVEHPSILETASQLEKEFGFSVTYLPVNEKGTVDLETLKSALKDDTILVSVMAVNNETGAINPIHEISCLLKKYPKIVFHSDVVQGIGKIYINFSDLDMFTIAGHKIHCFKGCGCLVKNKNINPLPLISGGGQENNYRSGTNDLALAVCLSKAIRLSQEDLLNKHKKVTVLHTYLYEYLKNHPENYVINSYYLENPYIINFSLTNRKASVLVEALSNRGIMVSSTSACHSKNETGSYVVRNMGKEDKLANNTIRISFSVENTLDEVKTLIAAMEEILGEIKQ